MSCKSLLLSSSVVLSLSATALFAQQSPAPAAGGPPPIMMPAPAAPQLTEAQMLEIYGWMTGMRSGLGRLELTVEEMGSFIKGLETARAGGEPGVDLDAAGPAISQFIQGKFEAGMAKMRDAEIARSAEFWTKIKAKPGVKVLPSGLAYEIAVPGSDRKPVATDVVRVNYTGALIDGTLFDSSEGRGPYETKLDQVIPGWTEGVPLIGEGGAIRLFVPPALAYGDYGSNSGDIPPGATLVFDIQLLAIVAPNEAAAAPTVTFPSQPGGN